MKGVIMDLLKSASKKLLIVGCAAVLYASLCTASVDLISYFPFSGRIFHLSPEEIDSIAVSFTAPNRYREIPDEDRVALAEYLNGLRYIFWLPRLQLGVAGGGSYSIGINQDGQSASVEIGRGTLSIKGITFFLPLEDTEYLISMVPS